MDSMNCGDFSKLVRFRVYFEFLFFLITFFLLFQGVPSLNVAPFDPHHAKYIEQRRGVPDGQIGGYQLILRDVSEFGWTNSKVTKYK